MSVTMKKERNYTIEFYRFIFAVGFIVGHIAIVAFRSFIPKETGVSIPLDTLLVFIALAGYFQMQHFKKNQQKAIENNISPVSQAWGYLKNRIKGLGPWFLLASLMGFIAIRIWRATPLLEWFDAFLNHLPEFCGLYLTGLGMGTPYDGLFGTLPAEYITLAQPLWFVSGLFITSYLLYYLLAKNEKVTLGIIVPATCLIFYGSLWINNIQPNWPFFFRIGDIMLNDGLVDMFCNLGIGCMIWKAVDTLKSKEFSKGFTLLITIVQAFLMIFIPFRTLCPDNLAFYPFTFDWPTAYLLSILFVFFLTLNKDKATKVLNKKCFGYLGSLSMYIYMFHWPIIIGVNALLPNLIKTSLPLYILVVVVITAILSVWARQMNPKLQNWLNSEPWFAKKGVNE